MTETQEFQRRVNTRSVRPLSTVPAQEPLPSSAFPEFPGADRRPPDSSTPPIFLNCSRAVASSSYSTMHCWATAPSLPVYHRL